MTTFIAGATGFVGQHLVRALAREGTNLRCGSRSPPRDTRAGITWVRFDVDDDQSVQEALAGVTTAYYLVHNMDSGKGYETRETRAARSFAREAAAAGVQRIVYLGGVAPNGSPSPHLKSRLRTGELLRAGSVPTLELRAGMIVGAGSESWRLCRDIALRLPLMVLPPWADHVSQPVAVTDVIVALQHAGKIEASQSHVYGIPGPETLRARDILRRTAELAGLKHRAIQIPMMPPKVAAWGARLLSGADPHIARELLRGLQSDLVHNGETLWDVIDHAPLSFDEAARSAMQRAERTLSVRLVESAILSISRAA